MSDNSDRPDDWLDELYQADNNDGPPAGLDASIRAAARNAHGVRPWYKRTGTLASVATLALALGITALWLGAPQDQATLSMAPAPMPAQDSLADTRMLVSESKLEEEALEAGDAPSSPAVASAKRAPVQERAASRSSPDSIERVAAPNMFLGMPADAEDRIAELQPYNCTTMTVIDVGDAQSYAVCNRQDGNSAHHPDCSQPYSLPVGRVAADRQNGSLIVLNEQRQWLRCDAAIDDWVITLLPDED